MQGPAQAPAGGPAANKGGPPKEQKQEVRPQAPANASDAPLHGMPHGAGPRRAPGRTRRRSAVAAAAVAACPSTLRRAPCIQALVSSKEPFREPNVPRKMWVACMCRGHKSIGCYG